MVTDVHPTAIIDPSVQLGDGVKVGPYCYISGNSTIGANTVLNSHVVIKSDTTIGENNQFFQFCSIGDVNQDKKYKGEFTQTIIGNNNIFREGVSVHKGTGQDFNATSIGNGNLLMCNVHIAHDCRIEDDNIMGPVVSVAGHVEVGNRVNLAAHSAIHQYCRVGDYAFVCPASMLKRDVPPFTLCVDDRAVNLNVVGLRRQTEMFSNLDISVLKRAFYYFFRDPTLNSLEARIGKLKELQADNPPNPHIINFLSFVEKLHESRRSVIGFKKPLNKSCLDD